MQELEALKAAVPGFMRRKGRSGSRISALEAAYEEYRLTVSPQTGLEYRIIVPSSASVSAHAFLDGKPTPCLCLAASEHAVNAGLEV